MDPQKSNKLALKLHARTLITCSQENFCHLFKVKSGAPLFNLLIPIDFFCFFFAGGAVIWYLGPR